MLLLVAWVKAWGLHAAALGAWFSKIENAAHLLYIPYPPLVLCIMIRRCVLQYTTVQLSTCRVSSYDRIRIMICSLTGVQLYCYMIVVPRGILRRAVVVCGDLRPGAGTI